MFEQKSYFGDTLLSKKERFSPILTMMLYFSPPKKYVHLAELDFLLKEMAL